MASGNTLIVFTPLEAELPATAYPQFAVSNNHPVIDFDPTTQEGCSFSGVLPRNYSGGGLTVAIMWITVATTGNVQFLGSFERMDAATNITSDSYAATQSTGTLTVPGTGGLPATQTIAFTNAQIDGLLAGEPFRFRIQRDPATDTCASDIRVVTVEIRET